MRDKLILLVGASGSGKTTIAKELEQKGFNVIHSYTTREPRKPNEWGHIFIDRAMWHGNTLMARGRDEELISVHKSNMIAYK